MTAVDVVVPAYNAAQSLRDCLRGEGLVYRGRRPRVLVVDNGSTDDSAEIARGEGAEVVSAGRPGPAAARNAGLAASSASFVAFLDADCIPRRGWLDAMMEEASSGGAAGIGGRIEWCGEDSGRARYYAAYYPSNRDCSRASPASYLLTSNALFRREALDHCGAFEADLPWCEDLELGIRMSSQGARFGYSDLAVVECKVPRGFLGPLQQFYKYGAGLEFVRDRHPSVVDWSAWSEFLRLVANLRSLWGPGGGSARFLCDLAYLSGTVDGSIRVALRRRFGRRHRLPWYDTLPARSSKRLLLTIDDGPSPSTGRVLDLLKEHSARAVFFLLGQRALEHPRELQRMVEEGHEVFAHGWSHRRFETMTTGEVVGEMERTEALLRPLRSTPACYWIRLPHGSGRYDRHVRESLRAWHPNCHLLGWTADAEDWWIARRCNNDRDMRPQCELALARLLQQVQRGGKVILLHDEPFGVDHRLRGEITTLILEWVVSRLHSQGYNFVSTREIVPEEEVKKV